ncbi:MAG TPA: GNAT family N-acetyltransferase [Jatrophihabitans sp.]|jgi:acyl-CoA synthetase (NDP forming)/GNAT superfamily N-acetyltransferase|nr:GNAT family N-acetyltransferase [Jatrophihabitans sp.]
MRTLQITDDDVDSLTSDGRVVHIRELRPTDLAEVQRLHERASDEAMYLRFFTLNRDVARKYAAGLVQPDLRHCVLGAFANTQLVGIGVLDRVGEDAGEFALLVADAVQHTGIGTLLLEHLIAEGRGRGVRRFVGEVLASNNRMLHVMRDLGFAATSHTESGETHVEFSLEVADRAIDAISAREQSAGIASLAPLLAPRSIAVIGAGQRPGSVGHEVLRNVLDGDFPGRVHVVNPKRDVVLGVPCVPTPAELPEAPDLAIIALPADRVADAVSACGERGIRAAVLLGAGFSEAGAEGTQLQDEVLAIARAHDMRLVGPNCIGIFNTDPAVRLDATFAMLDRSPGPLAVLAQSGAFGIALLNAAAEVGLGVAQFVSIGNKIDVGGNDLLLAWGTDPAIRVIAGYLESIGDPRRFARIARRVSQHKPVLVVKSGRTEAGQAAGRSHTAAAASSDIAIDALFRGSGVIRLQSMRELLVASRMLCAQPLPGGPRVAIVGNSGGPEILAADAAVDAGLVVAELDAATSAALRELGMPDQNPLDLGAAVSPDAAAAALRIVGASSEVDALISVFTPLAITDTEAMDAAITAAAAEIGKPVAAVSVGSPGVTRELPDTPWQLPVFTFPEEAAAALGVAYRCAQLRALPSELPGRPPGVDVDSARAIVGQALDEGRDWLGPEDAFRLLAGYGVPVCPHAVVTDPDAAVEAANRLGYPLAVKLAAPGLHKSEAGGVRLGIADEASLRAAVRDLNALGDGRVLLQPMISGGTELIMGAVHDPQCGPLVMVGAGGVLTDVLGDRAFGLAPLTDSDAAALVDSLRSARLLDGYRGAPIIDRSAVVDILVRVAALVDDLPQIAELDINPLIGRSDGLLAVDVRVRVAPPPRHPDPLVRQLRGPRGTL